MCDVQAILCEWFCNALYDKIESMRAQVLQGKAPRRQQESLYKLIGCIRYCYQ